MQSSRLCERNGCKGAVKLGALALLVLLTACERPLTPAPNRPQTIEQRRVLLLRKAIFRYDLPCAQSRHPRQPRGDVDDCRLPRV